MQLKRIPLKTIKKVQCPASRKAHLVVFDVGEVKSLTTESNERAAPSFYQAMQALVPILLRTVGISDWQETYDLDSMLGTRLTCIEFSYEDEKILSAKFTLKNMRDGVSRPTKLESTVYRDLKGDRQPYRLNDDDFAAIAALEYEALQYCYGDRETKQLDLTVDRTEQTLELIDAFEARSLPNTMDNAGLEEMTREALDTIEQFRSTGDEEMEMEESVR